MTHPALRAVRGAVQIDADDPELVVAGTRELLTEIMHRNAVRPDHLISLLFTMTPDLTSEFPAVAARRLGLAAVPGTGEQYTSLCDPRLNATQALQVAAAWGDPASAVRR